MSNEHLSETQRICDAVVDSGYDEVTIGANNWKLISAALTAQQAEVERGREIGNAWFEQAKQNGVRAEAAELELQALRSSLPQKEGGIHGPFGWLNGCRGLSEDGWTLESDPLENNDEYFSIPLYALVDPFKEAE